MSVSLFPPSKFPGIRILRLILNKSKNRKTVTVRDLAERTRVDKRKLYAALQILSAMGVIKKTRKGRINVYEFQRFRGDLLREFLANKEVKSVFQFLFKGIGVVNKLARTVYKRRREAFSTKASRVRCILEFGESLKLCQKNKQYFLTNKGRRTIFSMFIEDVYEEISREHQNPNVKIGDIREKICKLLNVSFSEFNKGFLKVLRFHKGILAFKAPLFDESVLKEGIKTSSGILHYIQISSFKWRV